MLSNQEKEYLSANKIATKTVNGKEYFICCFEFKEDFAEYYDLKPNANELKKQEPYKNFELLLKLRNSSEEQIFYDMRILTARNGFDKTLGGNQSYYPASLVYVCFTEEENNIVPVGSRTMNLSGKDFASDKIFIKKAERGNKLGNFLMEGSFKDMYKKNSEASMLNLVATSDGGKALIKKFYGIQAEYREAYNVKLKDTPYIVEFIKNDGKLDLEKIATDLNTTEIIKEFYAENPDKIDANTSMYNIGDLSDNQELSENSRLSSLPEKKSENPSFFQKLKKAISCKSVDVMPYH